MSCRECTHYSPSKEALGANRGLDGYGYCEAADHIETRARLFEDKTKKCWLPVNKFSKRVGRE